jgi:predicted Zn-dependent peptidase
VLAEPDPQASTVALQIQVRSGSLSDPVGKDGLAYYTARAMMRGTFTRPYTELSNDIEQLGASVTVVADQATTTFSCLVLSSNLSPFLDIMRDVLTQPAFDVTEMNTFQKTLEGELQSALQDPQKLAARAVLQTQYAGTAAAHPVTGTIVSTARITPQDTRAFFQSRYSRENIVIGATGPFTADELVSLIESKFDPIPHGKADNPVLPAPTSTGTVAIIVPRTGLATVSTFVAIPGAADNDPDMLALEVGNQVFGADMTGRLMQDLRVEHGWTYGAYSAYDQLISRSAQPAIFSEYFYPSTEYAALALPEGLKLLSTYAQSGIEQSEFQSAISALSNGYAFLVDTADKRLDLRMRQLLTGRPYLDTQSYQAALAKLSLSGVNSAIEKHTLLNNQVIVVVGDPTVLQPILQPLAKSVQILDIQP